MEFLTNRIAEIDPTCGSPDIIAQEIIEYAEETYSNNLIGTKLFYIMNKLNKETIDNLCCGTITVENLFNGSLYKYDENLVAYRNSILSNVDIFKKVGMKTYVCPRCKVRDQTIDEKQTRSLDEAATIKCVCNNCGKKWNGN